MNVEQACVTISVGDRLVVDGKDHIVDGLIPGGHHDGGPHAVVIHPDGGQTTVILRPRFCGRRPPGCHRTQCCHDGRNYNQGRKYGDDHS
jgi:hypothetical protein